MIHPAIREDYRISLVARTAFHVGAAATDPLADLALATDGQGRLYIPGTSWAGVLRSLARRVIGPPATERIFGPENLRDEDPGSASWLTVHDVPIQTSVVRGDAKPRIELRSGVGIDRRRGAAADRIRYDRLVVAAGTHLFLELRYEGPDHGGDLRRLVAVVAGAGLRVGAASSRGLGRLDCTTADVSRVDLTNRASLLAVLAGDSEPTPVPPATDPSDDVLRLAIEWRTRRPVLVGAATPSADADLVPLLTRAPGSDGLVPVLPGASVKGVLRSAAERVLRTLHDTGPPGDDFVAALDGFPGNLPAFEAVFGSRERAGALRIADTTATVRPLPESQDVSEAEWSRDRTHVGIDRWTGGASDGRLFTVAETQGVTWEDLDIELDLSRVGHDQRRAAVLICGIAIGQLVDGTIGFGRGTTRGLGEVEVTRLKVSVPGDLPAYSRDQTWWSWLREVAGEGDLPSVLGLARESA
jgi:CRISPR/Cas system CSM-associated protein Csm3 (group 7 of RAMP superfamily)